MPEASNVVSLFPQPRVRVATRAELEAMYPSLAREFPAESDGHAIGAGQGVETRRGRGR